MVSNGRRKREAGQKQVGIVTPPVLNPIRFPDDAEVLPVGYRIETTTVAPLKPIIFPGPIEDNRHLFLLEESPLKPQGVEHYFGEIKQSIEDQKDQENEVEVKELDPKNNGEAKSSDIVTIPLDITLNIVEAEINGTDRLVVGENDQLWVAGFGN